MRRLTAAAAAGTAVLVALHWDDVAAVYASIPPWAFAAAVALHVVSLILRSEACRLVLAAISGQPLPRVALHAWWVAPVAVTAGGLLLVAARLTDLRFALRPLAGGLAVLAHTRLRVGLAGLVGLVTLLRGARIWVLMAVTGLPVSCASVALVMLSLGVFGVVDAMAVGIVVAAGRARRVLGAGAGRLLPSER